jgi:hypothetical protein
LHKIFAKSGLDRAQIELMKKTIDPSNQHKPNLIFDVTLREMPKFSSLCSDATNMGYDKNNIHIVWVLNKLSVAMKQNKERDRVVADDIVISTHRGVAFTLKEIVTYFEQTSETCMNGDIWIAFNAPDEDTKLTKSKTSKGSYLEKATYVKIKETGKAIKSLSELSAEFQNKIENYQHM